MASVELYLPVVYATPAPVGLSLPIAAPPKALNQPNARSLSSPRRSFRAPSFDVADIRYVCAKLLIDSLDLSQCVDDDPVMPDQHIIDIFFTIKCLACDVEHFPINCFVDTRNDLGVAEFIEEWKKQFKHVRFDASAIVHLITSLGGEIGCMAIEVRIAVIEERMKFLYSRPHVP